MATTDVKTFIDGLSKPFSDMRMRKTALFSKFLSVISAIEDVQKSGLKTLATGITKTLRGKTAIANDLTKSASGGQGASVSKNAKNPPTAEAKELKIDNLNAGSTSVDRLVVNKLINKNKEEVSKPKRAGIKTDAEKAIALQEKQNDLTDRGLTLQEQADEFEDRQAALNDRRWSKSLPGMLAEHASSISGDFVETVDNIGEQVLGPLHETTKSVGNLAVSVLKKFKIDLKDKAKEKLVNGKKWLEDKVAKFKDTKLFRAMEKHLFAIKVFQKAQELMQVALAAIGATLSGIFALIVPLVSFLLKGAIIVTLANAILGALRDWFEKSVLPHLPDFLQPITKMFLHPFESIAASLNAIAEFFHLGKHDEKSKEERLKGMGMSESEVATKMAVDKYDAEREIQRRERLNDAREKAGLKRVDGLLFRPFLSFLRKYSSLSDADLAKEAGKTGKPSTEELADKEAAVRADSVYKIKNFIKENSAVPDAMTDLGASVDDLNATLKDVDISKSNVISAPTNNNTAASVGGGDSNSNFLSDSFFNMATKHMLAPGFNK